MSSAVPAIVYVHGLWMRGPESLLLRKRLTRDGRYVWHRFPYFSTLRGIGELADQLNDFAAAIPADTVHWLAHSLGGVLVQRCFERHPGQRPGRVVFLGTPSEPSRAAQSMARARVGRLLLGRAANEELLRSKARRWNHPQPLGIIAGSQPVGLGRLVTRFDGPNDGTVSVAETQLAGASAHLTLPLNHMSLLFSARVVPQIDAFLRTGQFIA